MVPLADTVTACWFILDSLVYPYSPLFEMPLEKIGTLHISVKTDDIFLGLSPPALIFATSDSNFSSVSSTLKNLENILSAKLSKLSFISLN